MSASHTILEDLERSGVLADPHRVLITFTLPVPPATVASLLAHPRVIGVVLASEADAAAFDGDSRVGYRYGLHQSQWRFPTTDASRVIVLGGDDMVGLRIARQALRSGVKSFVFADPAGRPVSEHTTLAVILRLVGQRIGAIGLRGVVAVRNRISAGISVSVGFVRQKWFDVVLWWKSVTAVVWENLPRIPILLRSLLHYTKATLITQGYRYAHPLLGHRLDEQIFAYLAQRMLRRAEKINTDIGPPTDTILLTIGSLGSGGSERQGVNTALMIKRAGLIRPVVVCARLGEPASMFYRPLLDEAGVEIVDLYQLDTAAACPQHERLLALCQEEGARLGYDMPEDLFRYLIAFLRERPRIVHSFLDENNIKAGLIAAMTRVPRIILGARSVAPDNFKLLVRNYMRPGYKVLLRRRNIVFYNNSNVGAADYRRWLRRPWLKSHVVHNGVDFTSFAPRDGVDRAAREAFGIPTGGLLVASVMRLSEEKQPLLWGRVVIELSRHRPDVNFVLIGDGPLRGDLQLLIANARIDSRVRFIHKTRDVPAVLRASDLFLLTSRVEGLPNVLIEAQAVGVPVVTTPAGGAAETLDPGATGFVAPDNSVRGIARTCLAVLNDDDLRARMAKAAPQFVRSKFSLDRMFADTLQLYGMNPREGR